MVFEVGCAVKRPNTDLCIVNAPKLYRKCYNMHDDYDENGRLKADATPEYRQNAKIEDLNKALVVDSPTGFEDGIANLKAYVQGLRAAYEECKKK